MAGRPPLQRIAVAGAGSIGCYVGGCLALAGRDVHFLLRPRLAGELAVHGLRVTDLEGRDRTLPPRDLRLMTDPAAAFTGAGLVLVTVKSGATAEMAALVAAHAPPDAVVVSLQNGIGNVDRLRAALPGRTVVSGMVPFNVLQAGQGRFHRGTEGALTVAIGVPRLREALAVGGLPLLEHPDMPAMQWGKLLINLNNALNALCGLPLRTELEDRRWRRVLAAMQSEALAVLRRAGITPARVGKVVPSLLPHILRLPDPLFRRVAKAMLSIDPEARSSMWEDLTFRRPTEVDYLQGAVVALADKVGAKAPLNARVLALVKQAEARGEGPPGIGPEGLL